MKWLAAERSHDLDALAQRVLDSYLGRSVLRFVRIEGFDRCIVLSAQTFTALIPLFIVVASATPTSDANAISDVIIERFALTGDSADAVQQLFQTPPGASSGVTTFSLLLLVYSGVAFTRRMQRMYRAAFDQEKAALRSAVYATLGLFALLLEIFVAYGIRVIFSHFPLESLWVLPVSLATGLVLWTSIPYLLLDRRVHWRRLLVTGGASALGMSLFGIATPIYMPQLMTKTTNEFGLFGITITIIGWLLVASFILVACAALGAEFDASDARWLVRLKTRFQLVDPGHEDLAAEPGRGPAPRTDERRPGGPRPGPDELAGPGGRGVAGHGGRPGHPRDRGRAVLPGHLGDLRAGQRRARSLRALAGGFPVLAPRRWFHVRGQRPAAGHHRRPEPEAGRRRVRQRRRSARS